jgi:hypothetical protein
LCLIVIKLRVVGDLLFSSTSAARVQERQEAT